MGPVIQHGEQDRLVFGLYEGEGFAQNYISQPHDSDPGPCNRYVEGLLAEDGSPLVGVARDQKLQTGKQEVTLFWEIMSAGGCEAEALDHIQPARWAKNLWNGAFSTMVCAFLFPFYLVIFTTQIFIATDLFLSLSVLLKKKKKKPVYFIPCNGGPIDCS
jgi:hypothetical protein